MKKNLARVAAVLVPIGFVVVACGDDVIDASASGEEDASVRADATNIPPPPDGAADARNDSPDSDVDADVDVDAADGAVPDADAGEQPDPRILTFVNALGAAACTKYETCCAGATPEPAPGRITCTQAIQQDPQFFSALLDPFYFNVNVASSTRVRIDQALADSCLAKVNAMACLNVAVPAADWKAILQDCSQALYGIGVDGDPCYSDIECDKDHVCNTAVRGGAPGTCRPVRPLGELYTSSAQYDGDSCSYRGFGFGTGRRAQPDSAAAEASGAYRCLPQQALGDPCVPFTNPDDFRGSDKDCASYACGFNDAFDQAVCVDVKTDLFYCDQYVSAVP